MIVKNSFILLLGLSFLVLICCTTEHKDKTDEELYTKKIIFSDDEHKTKIKLGDNVTFYYCLKNGDKVVMSSDQVVEPTTVTIPKDRALNKFEKPLLWLGLGDSCVVELNADEAVTELSAYQQDFNDGDKATFIYKVLKIE